MSIIYFLGKLLWKRVSPYSNSYMMDMRCRNVPSSIFEPSEHNGIGFEVVSIFSSDVPVDHLLIYLCLRHINSASIADGEVSIWNMFSTQWIGF